MGNEKTDELDKLHSTYDKGIEIIVQPRNELLAEHYYGEENLAFMRRKARLLLRDSIVRRSNSSSSTVREVDLRVEELIDAVYDEIVRKYSDDDLITWIEDDFRMIEAGFMNNIMRSERSAKSDKRNSILYPKSYISINEKYDTGGDEDETFDRTDSIQVEKGDGLDEIFENPVDIIDDCKSICTEGGIPTIQFIVVFCLVHQLIKALSPSEGLENGIIFGVMQSIFGMTPSELENVYIDIQRDPNLMQVVKVGLNNTDMVIEECKKYTRCGALLYRAEELVKEMVSD